MDDPTFIRQTFWTVMKIGVPVHLLSLGLRVWLGHMSTLEVAFNAYMIGVYSSASLIFWLQDRIAARIRRAPPPIEMSSMH